MIYTSYIARVVQHRGIPQRVIPILRRPPAWLREQHPEMYARNAGELAPSHALLDRGLEWRGEGRMTPQQWTQWSEAYRDELTRRMAGDNPREIVRHAIEEAGRPEEPILACVCGPGAGEQCHRYVLAEWLREHGVEVEEWRPAEEAVQISLLGGLL